MENKSLKTLQVLARVGKVISKITFIACIVGVVLSLTGIACLLAGFTEPLKVGGVTVYGVLGYHTDVTVNTMYVAVIVALIGCLSQMFVSGRAVRYFKNELLAGTPFTIEGARELTRLGVTTIVIPCVALILEQVIYEVMRHTLQGVSTLQLDGFTSVGVGIAFLVIAVFCRYGASLNGEGE